MAQPDLPDPPVDVRVVYEDRQEVPVDTVYEGQDEHGIHQWSVVNVTPRRRVINLKIGALPPHTSVSIPWEP